MKNVQKKISHLIFLSFAGFGEFRFPKNSPEVRLSEAASFSWFLSTICEFSTGHVLHLFQLKFSVVTSCVLLSSEKNIKKRVQKKSRKHKKKKIYHKKKEEKFLHGKASLSCVCVCCLVLCFLLFLLSIILVTTHTWCLKHVRPATRTSTWDYHSALLPVTDLCSTYTFTTFCVPSKLHRFLQIITGKILAISVPLPHCLRW